MSFNTQHVVRSAKKHKASLLSGGSLGLSGVAVAWMFHTFLSLHQYERDQSVVAEQNKMLWHEIHQIEQKGNK